MRDSLAHGWHRNWLSEAEDHGYLTRLGRGLYTKSSVLKLPRAVIALFRTRHAIAALETSLHVHQLLAPEPPVVWLAIAEHARKPRFDLAPVETIRWRESPDPRDVVQVTATRGLVVPAFTPTKTAVDLLRFRRRVGLRLAERLATFLIIHETESDELLACARRYRAETPVRRFLDGKLFDRDDAWNPADPFAVSP